MEFTSSRSLFLMLDNEEILELLNDMTSLDLYSISTSWRESDDYILKVKGSYGDVIVRWE